MKITRSWISSQISTTEYDPERELLTVTFNSGGIYDYTPVSQELYEKLVATESIGKSFNEHIKKNDQIKTTRLS